MELRKLLASHLLAAMVAASFVEGARAQTPPAPAPQTAQIDRNGLLILVKSTLIALDQANKTGNYTVLRDLAAPGFASANNAARLAEIFANLRRDRIDLSGVLVLEPQLTAMPEINANGMLHMAGFFPSAPTQINFEFLFAPVDGQWRLFGLAANLGSSSPVAPAPPAAAKPAPSEKPAASAADGKKSDKKPTAEKP
jgi:hypothetical protein